MDHLTELQNGATVPEVAEAFGKSERTVYRWHSEGRLRGYRVGRELRFARTTLAQLAETMSTSEARPAA